jgi:hypothetical protein
VTTLHRPLSQSQVYCNSGDPLFCQLKTQDLRIAAVPFCYITFAWIAKKTSSFAVSNCEFVSFGACVIVVSNFCHVMYLQDVRYGEASPLAFIKMEHLLCLREYCMLYYGGPFHSY